MSLDGENGVPVRLVHDCLAAHATRSPDALALVEGEERITYSELARRSHEMACVLARADVGHGDIVAVSLPNCRQFIACFFAASELGAILFPCNPGWQAREIAHFTGRLHVRCVVTTCEHKGPWLRLPEATRPPGILAVDGARIEESGCGASAPPRRFRPVEQLSPDDPFVYLATSGSTGIPKIVPVTHQGMIARASSLAAALRLDSRARAAGVVSFFHGNGLDNGMWLPLSVGAALVIVRQFSPLEFADVVRKEGIDTLAGSPALYDLLTRQVTDRRAFSGLQRCLSSGGPLAPQIAAVWKDRFGLRIRQIYGSTETSVVACEREDDPETVGSVGRPLPGVEVRIAIEPKGWAPRGATGLVAVRGPAVMAGYLGDPAASTAAFCDGFLLTEDRGYLDSEGRLILIGRTSRRLNLGGIKVDPAEVEQVIEAMPGVLRCRVTAGRSPSGNDFIRASVVRAPRVAVTRADVVRHCRQHLAEFKIPRAIELAGDEVVDLTGKSPTGWCQGT